MKTKKIAIYTKGEQYMTATELQQWSDLLYKHNIDGIINAQQASNLSEDIIKYGLGVYQNTIPDDVDIIVSYGGDGTLLQAVDQFHHCNKPFMAINSGRLGFLASIPRGDIEHAILTIKNGLFSIEERSLISARSTMFSALGFNEFTIQKSSFSMINIRVCINGEFVADYMSDGLIVSTPTGSTAYSMSVGGPIITPQCDCMLINPIAPHNLNMRPLVVSGDVSITIKAYSRDQSLIATVDNRSYEIDNMTEFTVTKSSDSIKLVKLHGNSFYHTIREKLMWGMDNRSFERF